MSKQKLREEIARQTQEFLAKGGAIEAVSSKRVCPKHMKWISSKGMDYSTWDEIGGADWYRRDGAFQLDPEDFEED